MERWSDARNAAVGGAWHGYDDACPDLHDDSTFHLHHLTLPLQYEHLATARVDVSSTFLFMLTLPEEHLPSLSSTSKRSDFLSQPLILHPPRLSEVALCAWKYEYCSNLHSGPQDSYSSRRCAQRCATV